MSRAERRRQQRDEAKDQTVYKLTPKQLDDMRANIRREVKAELTKQYDQRWDEYVKQYEQRINDIIQVSTNRSLIYILGLGVDVLTRKFGFTKKQNHKWFDEVRMLFNEAPDLIKQLTVIEEFSGWNVAPTLDELIYKEEQANE